MRACGTNLASRLIPKNRVGVHKCLQTVDVGRKWGTLYIISFEETGRKNALSTFDLAGISVPVGSKISLLEFEFLGLIQRTLEYSSWKDPRALARPPHL